MPPVQPGKSLGTTPLLWFAVSIFAVAIIAIIVLLFVAIIRTKDRPALDYGNFYVVALGILGAITGFLVILSFIGGFTDISQALGFLTALFGVITGLVGTYFGVKSSSEAREGTQQVALAAVGGGGITTPTITIAPPDANLSVSTPHTATATVTSVDKSPAGSVDVTFTIIDGPDMGITQTIRTDASGQAPFTFTNNGTAGTDTIEAAALGEKGTSKVTFG